MRQKKLTIDNNAPVVAITGGGRGMGQACAVRFARAGYRVALLARTESELKTTADLCRRAGGPATLIHAGSVADEAVVETFFFRLMNELGPVQILINNAGTYHMAPIWAHETGAFDDVLRTNLYGPFFCSREAIRQMKKAKVKGGCIINIGSLGGLRRIEKFPGFSAYVASKFALTGFTEALAVECAPLGIRVNTVAPGAVDTKMLRDAVPKLRTKTKPDDIAALVFALCQDDCKVLQGSLVEVFSNS